jgi:hypothetical protein
MISFTACRFGNKIVQLHWLQRVERLKVGGEAKKKDVPPERVQRGTKTWNG